MKTYTAMEIIKLICILVIGVSNATTFAILFATIFHNMTLSIASAILVSIATVCLFVITITNKRIKSKQVSND